MDHREKSMNSQKIERVKGKYIMGILIIVFLFLALIWSWWINFSLLPLNPDSGYFLSTAERIYEGWKPYKDLHVEYPPVGLYYFALFRTILGEGQFTYKISLLVIEIFSAWLLFLLSGSVIKNRILRFIGSLFFLLMYQSYGGGYIVLEYFVVVFSLLTILLLTIKTKRRLLTSFLAGISFLLSILSKQYAVVIIPAIAILLIRDSTNLLHKHKSVVLRTLFFFAGFSVSFLITLWFLGVNFMDIMSQLCVTEYGNSGIYEMFKSLFSLRNMWFIPLTLLSIYIVFREFQFNRFIILLLFILSFSPLYVRGYFHYYQLILPYGMILLLVVIEHYYFQELRPKIKGLETAAVLFLWITVAIALSFSLQETIYYSLNNEMKEIIYEKVHVKKETMQEDMELAERINKILPPGSLVLVINKPQFSYLCNFKPPLKDIGYTFLVKSTLKYFDFTKIKNIVWFDGNMFKYETFLQKVENTHNKISEIRFADDRVEIWEKKQFRLSRK
jgi:4-amino-4-deoxy-L-arabinose transferase-like glycosyltransferase